MPQKEKRRLARKRSRASKHEREREAAKAAKAAKLPMRQRQCKACGRKFKSCKTAKKHKCPKSKVVCVAKEAATGQASQATPRARSDTPLAKPPPHAPAAWLHDALNERMRSSNNEPLPVVTEGSQDNSNMVPIYNPTTGQCMRIRKDKVQRYKDTGQWRPGFGPSSGA